MSEYAPLNSNSQLIPNTRFEGKTSSVILIKALPPMMKNKAKTVCLEFESCIIPISIARFYFNPPQAIHDLVSLKSQPVSSGTEKMQNGGNHNQFLKYFSYKLQHMVTVLILSCINFIQIH
jgi:hypothetical protein